MNSFIAIYNQSGIAMASDTDNAIYRLSKQEPVAIAVCPHSPIPWSSLITNYQRQGEPVHHKTLEEYARDFEAFFQEFPADKAWNKLGIDDANLIFLGYGEDDIYPSVCNIQVKVNEATGKLELGDMHTNQISISNDAGFNWNGDFERLATILRGSTKKVKKFAEEKQLELFDAYKKRITEKFKGTKYEEYVNDCFSKYEQEKIPHDTVVHATSRSVHDVHIGMETFNIEEMVTSAENLVNGNVRLNHLKNGGKGLIGSTREIAVLTRAEGFTWIKHSLFAI